jgi:hypothetical protein
MRRVFLVAVAFLSLFAFSAAQASAVSCAEAMKDEFGEENLIQGGGCVASVAACAKQANGGIVSLPQDDCVAPAVCCALFKIKPSTCLELAKQTRETSVVSVKEAKCAPSCESGFVEIVAKAKDCSDLEKCCAVVVNKELTPVKGSPTDLPNPLGTASFFTVINRIITAFLGMVGALAFAVFVYAGVTWMTAGSSDRVQRAKDAMKYAVIGLLIIAFAFAITNFIIDALAGPASVATPGQSAQEPIPLGQ